MRSRLKDIIKDRGWTNEYVGKNIGVNGSTISKILTNRQTNIETALKMVRFVEPPKETEYMRFFSLEADKPSNILVALEYASTTRNLDVMGKLLETAKQTPTLIDFSVVYELQYKWQSDFNNVEIKQQLRTIRSTHVGSHDAAFFLKILEIYGYYYQQKYNHAFELCLDLEEDFNFLKDGYLKDSYGARLNEIKSYVYLKVKDNPELARECANFVIESNIGANFNGFANFIKGYSYIFTDYNMAKKYLTLSKEIYTVVKPSNAADMDEKLEFLDILWDKIVDPSYHNNKLYLAVKKKERNVDLDLIKESDKPFYLYLKGIYQQDKEILQHSLIAYLKKGDTFLANLPRIELLKLGASPKLLEDMMSIHN